MCYSIIPHLKIKLCQVSSKILIFGQVMAKLRTHAHINWAYIFGQNPIYFRPIGQKFFTGAQQASIYLLVMGNPSQHAFLATFVGKMGVETTCTPNYTGRGPPNPTKKLTHWLDLLAQNNNFDNSAFGILIIFFQWKWLQMQRKQTWLDKQFKPDKYAVTFTKTQKQLYIDKSTFSSLCKQKLQTCLLTGNIVTI